MTTTENRLADGLLLAKNILDSCKKKYPPFAIPVQILKDGVLDEVSCQVGLRIDVFCLPWQGFYHRGKLLRYKDYAVIQYAQECNTCWARFVIAKELFHILIGDEKNFSTDMEVLINGLLNEAAFPLDKGLEAETLAVIGALAFLIPPYETANIQKMKADGLSDYQIGKHYRVPEKVIPLRLTKNFVDAFDKFA